MSNLVERLRKGCIECGTSWLRGVDELKTDSLLDEAADEIERLQTEIAGDLNAKEQLYDILFPGEHPDEREVRWKWILLQASELTKRATAATTERKTE